MKKTSTAPSMFSNKLLSITSLNRFVCHGWWFVLCKSEPLFYTLISVVCIGQTLFKCAFWFQLAFILDVWTCSHCVFSPTQPGSATHLALVRETANFKLKYGRKKEAISDLEQLWKWVKSLLNTRLVQHVSSLFKSHRCWFYFFIKYTSNVIKQFS